MGKQDLAPHVRRSNPGFEDLEARVRELEDRFTPKLLDAKQAMGVRLKALALMNPDLFGLRDEPQESEAERLRKYEELTALVRGLVATGWRLGDEVPDSFVADCNAIGDS